MILKFFKNPDRLKKLQEDWLKNFQESQLKKNLQWK